MLGRFIHATQLGIAEVRRQESDRIEKQRSETSAGFLEVTNACIDHSLAHSLEIPRLVLYGQVFSLYSMLETRLRLLCDEVGKRDTSIGWTPKDFAGNMNLKSFRIFLTKAVDAGVSVWDSIDTLRLARNCIAHANGWIADMAQEGGKLRRRIESDASLDMVDGRLVVQADYIIDRFRDCHTLFREAFTALNFGPGLMPFEYPPETGVRPEAKATA